MSSKKKSAAGNGGTDAGSSFDSVLVRLLALARTARTAADAKAAMVEVDQVLKNLDQEALAKVQTLVCAGRDAHDLRVARAGLAKQPKPAAPPLDLFAAGAPALEDLHRGYAIARATEFDLETTVGEWSSTDRRSLDERVWLRFGRELAMAEPGAWSCRALVRGKELERLYLRRTDGAWWSFDSVVDRPSTASVEGQKRATKANKALKVVPLQLGAIVEYHCHARRRAVRRAVLAIQARLGSSRALPAA